MLSVDEKWLKSNQYYEALYSWHRHNTPGTFEQSQEFRDARLSFRREVNQSWGKEST